MGQYKRNGQQVLFEDQVVTHIADAADSEKADFLVQAANSFNTTHNYIDEARQTLSPSWHGELVGRAYFEDVLARAIAIGNQLDLIKKALFYGRIPEAQGKSLFLNSDDIQLSEQYLYDRIGDGNADPRNIVHGVIGNFTEATELLEALHNGFFEGEGFDPVNMREEIGDQFWYIAILLFEAARDGDGYTFDECMRVNIAKLRARFPNRFTEYDANTRDLHNERRILEGN